MIRTSIPSNKAVFKLILIGVIALISACSSENKEVECVDPPQEDKKTKKVVTRDRLNTTGWNKARKDADWCRTCVMGPKGWASCQVAYAEKEGESRDVVKKRSQGKACDDAGFEKGTCPTKAVVAQTCKGDKSLKKNEGQAKALQGLFFPKGAPKKKTNDTAKAPAEKQNPSVDPTEKPHTPKEKK
ncbi:MAG: hypothetical protein GY847_35450 [Proteobacteria bacterium]|nr:hypothetical protein [Pseudomonadota bacterium]